ncbi:MAG: hypothetical protein ACXWYD_20650 [Candidatus Binatia bacterium]
MQIACSPHQIFKSHILVILFLACLHAVFATILIVFNIDYAKGFAHLFRMDFENNVPTIFSGFALLTNALFSLIIFFQFKIKTYVVYGWLYISIILLFLCLDEVMQIHELFTMVGRSLMGWELESRRSAWFIVYAPLPFLTVLLLWKWFWLLPKATQIGLVVSGLMFLISSVGIEIIQGFGSKGLTSYEVNRKVWFQASVVVEETMEMLAVALALRTILLFMSKEFGGLFIGEQSRE